MGVKTKKILVKIGILLIALFTLGLVTRAIFNYTTGKRLERLVEKMKSEGKPMTMQEVEPECDNQENGALSWRGAEAMILIEKNEIKLLNNTIEDIFYGRPLDGDTKNRLTQIISKNQKVLQLVREAANKPCFKYAKNWDKHPEEIDLPDVIKMLNAVRLCGIDSVLKAEDGQLDEALEQCRVGMLFSHRLLDEPFLINFLIAVYEMKQLIFCLNRVIAAKEIETNTLLNILKELDTKPWRRGLVWSFETEKILSFDTGIRTLAGDYTMIEPSFVDKAHFWLFRPVLKTEIVWIIQQFEKMEKAAKSPYFKTKEVRKIFERKYRNTPKYYRIAKYLSPNLITVMFKEATLEATLLSAQIGIACKIYKNQQGEFPEKVSQVVPQILKNELIDPFTGKPFIYRRQDTGFIVYSVGSNEKDDEGRGTRKITSIVMEKDDDWTWKEEMNEQDPY